MTTQDDPPARRLNPFAFPSETDFRFVLLIILLVSVCIANFYILFLTTPTAFQRAYFDTLEECFRRFPPDFAPALESLPGLDGLVAQLDTARNEPAQSCILPVVNRLFLRVFAATAGVLIVAGLIFLLLPRWTIRRHGLSPLMAEDAPDVVACLENLCAEMGLRSRSGLHQLPVFLWNPLDATRSAFTFGNLSDQYVALSMGLVTRFYADREAFRAVVLHELAHLKNADLARTQFATAVWLAFLACAALPGLVFSLFIDVRGSGFGLLGPSRLWQLLMMTGLVYFARNGILRAREYYADVRASRYLAGPRALEQVLADAPPQPGPRLRRLFATHPPADRRAAVLNDTRPLFLATFEIAAITGAVMGLINATTDLWATSLGQLYFGQISALSLLLAVLLMGTVGLSVWRGATAGLLHPPVRQRLGRVALGVGAGLFIGAQLFDMAGTLDFLGAADPATIIGLELFLVLWALLAMAITYAAGLWSITCATAWSEVAAARRSPRIVYVVWFPIAAGVMAILVYPLTLAYALGQGLVMMGGAWPVAALFIILGGIPAYLLSTTLGPVLFTGLWALPLAAWLFRRKFRPIGEAPWGFLEPGAPGGSEAARPAFDIPFAVRSALGMAAVFLVLPALKWAIRLARGVEPGPGVDYGDFFGGVILGAAVLLQVVVAVRVVRQARQFRLTQALFATCILAALMSTINNLVNGIVESGSPLATLRFYWDDFEFFWGLGLLVSLPVCLVVLLLRGNRPINDSHSFT